MSLALSARTFGLSPRMFEGEPALGLVAAAALPLAVSKGTSGTFSGSVEARNLALAIGGVALAHAVLTKSPLSASVSLGSFGAALAMIAMHGHEKDAPK